MTPEANIDLPSFASLDQKQDNQKTNTLKFPNVSQVGQDNKVQHLQGQVKQKDDNEHPAHDPSGSILEKNVMETQKMLQEQARRVGHTLTANSKPNTLERIRIILKHKGLDSQQMEQSLKEIEQVLKEDLNG